MSDDIKRAIKSAQERLEDEQNEKLKTDIYEYLKSELESIDSIDSRIRKLNEEKRVHEENIKNLKQGNLQAIEKRREALVGGTIVINNWPSFTTLTNTSSSGTFYYSNLAGTTITTTAGKTYIF